MELDQRVDLTLDKWFSSANQKPDRHRLYEQKTSPFDNRIAVRLSDIVASIYPSKTIIHTDPYDFAYEASESCYRILGFSLLEDPYMPFRENACDCCGRFINLLNSRYTICEECDAHTTPNTEEWLDLSPSNIREEFTDE